MEEIVFLFEELFFISISVTLILTALAHGPFFDSVKTVASLCILLVLLNLFSPFISKLLKVPNFDAQDKPLPEYSFSDDAIINETRFLLEQYTKQMITDRFGISDESFNVGLTFDKNESGAVILKNVSLIFVSSPLVSPTLVSSFVSDNLMCECIVILPD